MEGEWGVGASLAMESIPGRWRGTVSGLLQAGYPSGYLLASIVYWISFPLVGWRGMFVTGALPALLVLYIRRAVQESPDWAARQAAGPQPSIWAVLGRNIGLTVYVVPLMTALNFFSHGTQDLYPTFLQVRHKSSASTLARIAIIYNIGAILGGIGFGSISQRIGRRTAIVIAAVAALPIIPLWTFAASPVALGLGAVLLQICVQGAWGVIPAHLNEPSPAEIRGTFPGVTYQLDNLLASASAAIQSAIATGLGGDFWRPLVAVAGICTVIIALMVGFGREARDVEMKGMTMQTAAT